MKFVLCVQCLQLARCVEVAMVNSDPFVISIYTHDRAMDSNFGSPGGEVLVATLVVRTVTCLCVTLASRFYRFLARFSGRRRSLTPGRAAVGRPACPTASCRMPPPLATLVLVVSTVLGVADACSSRSTPKPRPPAPTARPNITFHTYECPPAYAKWYCLNQATCFTVKIGESLLYNCECADGYMGQRCEFKDLEGTYIPSRQRVMLETASVAGGATMAVCVVVILCVFVYMRYQRRAKESRASCVDGSRDLEKRPFSRDSLEISIGRINQIQKLREYSSPMDDGQATHHSLSRGSPSGFEVHSPASKV